MTMIRPPADAPVQPSPDPASRGNQRLAGIQVRVTSGGYLLGVLAAGLGALILPLVTPGKPALSYLAATVGVVLILLASMIAHELGHAVVVRRYRGSAEATVGFFGGVSHGRAELPSARAQWQVAVAGPLVSLLLADSAWPPWPRWVARRAPARCCRPRWPPRRPGSMACSRWPT